MSFGQYLQIRDAILDNDSKHPAPLNFIDFINSVNHVFELIGCLGYWDNTFCVSTELLCLWTI